MEGISISSLKYMCSIFPKMLCINQDWCWKIACFYCFIAKILHLKISAIYLFLKFCSIVRIFKWIINHLIFICLEFFTNRFIYDNDAFICISYRMQPSQERHMNFDRCEICTSQTTNNFLLKWVPPPTRDITYTIKIHPDNQNIECEGNQ